MLTFTEPNAYSVIEDYVFENLDKHIKKKKEDVERIVIVGAYHGTEIEAFLSRYPNAQILAFEPYPKNFHALVNKYKNISRVSCFKYAVSDHIGEADFHELNAEGNGSLLKVSDQSVYKLKEVETIKVKLTTLDSMIGNLPVDLLWMDVQGNELNVLKGYSNCHKIPAMFLEIAVEGHNHESYEGNCHLNDLVTYLPEHSLEAIGLDNELKNGTGNALFVRKDLI